MGSEYIDPVTAGREAVAASGLDPAELVTYDYVGGQACKLSRIEALTRGIEHWTCIDDAPQWAKNKLVKAAAESQRPGASPSMPIFTDDPATKTALGKLLGTGPNPGPAMPIYPRDVTADSLPSLTEATRAAARKWNPPRVTLHVDAREVKAVRAGCRTANPYPLGGSPSPASVPAAWSAGQGSDILVDDLDSSLDYMLTADRSMPYDGAAHLASLLRRDPELQGLALCLRAREHKLRMHALYWVAALSLLCLLAGFMAGRAW